MLSEVRRAFEGPPARRGILVAQACGWNTDRATVERPASAPMFGRFDLNSAPTTASVTLATSDNDLPPLAYVAGFRWLLDAQSEALIWYDLAEGCSWSASVQELSDNVLEGFTPAAFAKSGRLAPEGISPKQLSKVSSLPGVAATEFLLNQIEAWWTAFLAGETVKGDEAKAKQNFVRAVSALLLIKTACAVRGDLREDLGAERLDRPKHVRSSLERAAVRLNSRVLRDISQIQVSDERLSELTKAIDRSNIDLSRLDVDPVGAFYERFLGQTEQVEARPQLGLFELNQDIRVDSSIRRALGTYYTPKQYADFLARRLVRPAVRAANVREELPIIFDPAVGSGELLCAALRELFQVREWRHADVAKDFLDSHIVACDVNSIALQLAALNILRTSIRHVPDMLDGLLPSLESTFRCVDTLQRDALKGLPKADVALLNPPFLSRNRWRPTETHADDVQALGAGANAAFAFLNVAIQQTREGGAVGAVMPSQPLSDSLNRRAREVVSSSLAIDTIVQNFGTPFPGTLSYAGLVLGHVLKDQYPITDVFKLRGGAHSRGADFAAAIAGASSPRSGAAVSHESLGIDEASAWNWTGELQYAPLVHHGSKARYLMTEWLSTSPHDAISPAPDPWGRGLFLFRSDSEFERLVHVASEEELPSGAQWLRQIATPRHLFPVVPCYCEPTTHGVWCWLPGPNGDGVRRRDIPRDFLGDIAAYKMILKTVRRNDEAVSDRASAWLRLVTEESFVSFLNPRGFVNSPCPQVVVSRGTLSSSGRGPKSHWNVWVNLDGSTVPLGGYHMRARTAELAIAIACFLNVDDAINDVIKRAPRRNLDSTQPRLADMVSLIHTPDLESSRVADAMAELVASFYRYRQECEVLNLNPSEAKASSAYSAMISCARRLWLM